VVQPHWQFCSWQTHSFCGHPQEQDPHPQLHVAEFFAAFTVVVFFTLDIVFLLFVLRVMRFHRG